MATDAFTTVDKDALNLSRSIGLAETGQSGKPNYNAVGKSGEKGAYQWMPGNFESQAKEAGLDPNDFSPQNQDKVAYYHVKQLKDEGLQPWEIASKWNSGSTTNWQNHNGTNSQGVGYNTPQYVASVKQHYLQMSGESGLGDVPSPQLGGQNSFLGDVGQTLTKAGTRISDAIGQTASGQINPVSGLIHGLGGAAGAVGGLTNNVLEHTPLVGTVYKGAENLIGKGVGALAKTNAGQGLISNYQGFAQAHPELAGDISSGVDIASAVPLLKGLGLAKGAVTGGIETALRGGTDAALETVAPKLSAKEAADALVKRGTVQKGLLRETQIAPDTRMQDIAQTVEKNVPKFNPAKPLVKNIAETQSAVDDLKASLKADVAKEGAGKIYPPNELIARLKKIEIPDLIASDTTLNNVYGRLINRVEGIAEAQGGKVENLPDILGDFDKMVKRQYPNLYNSDTLTPLRQGVKDIREEIKTFAEEKMPSVGLKDRMLTVHKLLTAMENMAEKATSGGAKEIGTNALTRLAGRHPVIKGLVKTGAKYAAEGTGIGTALRVLGH